MLARFGVVVAAVLLALLLCESALRLLLPKYRNAAEGRLQPDHMRIWAPAPNSRDWWVHPDTLRRHPLHRNNLGLRQHRDFADADIRLPTTVGVFGDSFVGSVYLDSPYVFTEPLDHLLNLAGNFTVLNFGVDAYGPAQSYFTYRSFHAKEDLDYVLFVYFGGNDIADLVDNRLFDLDDRGQLRQREVRGSAWWVPLASRLHLTYLALDATGRLAPHIADLAEALPPGGPLKLATHRLPDDLLSHGLEMFRQLIRRWRAEVEESGAKFLVVLLPTQPHPRVHPLLGEEGVGVVDLNACYESRDEGHRDRAWKDSPYRFENDSHWNELGNRLAAICLDERLRREAGLPAMGEAARDAALAEYYAAFADSPGEAVPARDAAREPSRSVGDQIRRKYQALGRFEDALESRFTSDRLVLESNPYDVYVIDRQWIIFENDDCHADDATERLFAHATPVDASIVSPDRSYLSLRARREPPRVRARAPPPLQEDGRCIVRWRVPQFALSHILVGQRDSANAMLWSGEIVLDRTAFERTMEAMLAAAGEPVIESAMEVYVHGQRIFYVSDDCQRTDGRTPFFLHVAPVREADLPPHRIEHGYDNIDFHQVGATLGVRCVVRWHLPDHPIRHIRTGQYVVIVDGDEQRFRRLWSGDVYIGG